MTSLIVFAALYLILLAAAFPIYLVLCAISWLDDRTWDKDHELAAWIVKACAVLAAAGAIVSVR